MKDFQKEALRKLRPTLVEKVIMDGLLTEMEGLDMLNKRMSAQIKSKPTKYQQVEDLLDFLSTRDDKAFDNFVKALDKNHDKEVANMLREATENASQESPRDDTSAATSRRDVLMSTEHKAQMRKSSEEIISHMTPGKLSNILHAAGVLTDDDKEIIDAQVTSTQKNELIMKYLPKKPDWAYDEFIKALVKTEQPHLVKLLKL